MSEFDTNTTLESRRGDSKVVKNTDLPLLSKTNDILYDACSKSKTISNSGFISLLENIRNNKSE